MMQLAGTKAAAGRPCVTIAPQQHRWCPEAKHAESPAAQTSRSCHARFCRHTGCALCPWLRPHLSPNLSIMPELRRCRLVHNNSVWICQSAAIYPQLFFVPGNHGIMIVLAPGSRSVPFKVERMIASFAGTDQYTFMFSSSSSLVSVLEGFKRCRSS